MTFTYTRKIAMHYDYKNEKYYCDEYDFDYSPEENKLFDALVDILVGQTNVEMNKEELLLTKRVVKQMILDSDTKDLLLDKYEDELKDWFEDVAMASEGD